MSTKQRPVRESDVDPRRVLNVDQAADYLGVSRRHLLRELVKRPVSKGGLPFIVRPGSNRRKFLLSDLDAWLARWRDER